MEVDRRSLMKGMLASGALLALGVPPWTFADQPARRPQRCMLVLGGTPADEAFAHGTQAASAAMMSEGCRTVHLKGGLLTGMNEMVNLLHHSRGVRMIVILDDASAVIFLELVRSAGVRMLSLGTHACSTDSPWPIRHDLVSTSQDHSAGGLLASQLIPGQGSFSIMESYLRDVSGGLALTGWSAPGFCSYRSAEPEPIHLHCSDLSLPDGCRLLALDTPEKWIPILPQAYERGCTAPRSQNWVEAVGYAVTASALGIDSFKETCSGRAFLHRTTDRERPGPQERFMSFVMDL
ncbi:MAG: hypothetical protein Nkreftii_003317 [Candidatus Nitrospira kreftii]|uniref:Uncharacterized protein n=1 Tax=Candidatus Nitrospira kreftii TaxID=2652173 RepID=A0A7S8FGU6_9BACT|nr:MAG: hypothetical protein Nkreftii_003317 [Candidatus Nitrospira kreftii]